MATVDECRVALRKLGEQFDEVDRESRDKHVVERSISCHIKDLGVTFYGHIHHGGLGPFEDLSPDDRRQAEVKLTIGSDDLISLVNGDLDMGRAVFGGRIKVDASFGDLIRLRKLL
ncbi:SCP2 sterol-binding domain-containing protein [Streptosporangium sp. NPDC000509]|uniref:SCP2 sterol-binding domain-containing protein n=1 Tax=Streptosporangium sp. NPDC000509 TaxID=3366186 RepID=UPI00368470C0